MNYFWILLVLISGLVQAQTVTVLDGKNNLPIENVIIKSEKLILVTNKFGQADLSRFDRKALLRFEHVSYAAFTGTLMDLERRNFMLELSVSSVKMDEVVISASRWEEKLKEVPNKISSVHAKEIEFFNPQTSADLIGITDKVFIQKSQMGGGSPMIRGFSTNRILIVVDGVRMNNAIYRSGNLQNVLSIDANSIENTEVVFGPGSVIYGSDAVGGVMSFNTLQPRLSVPGECEYSGNAMTRYSSANNEKTGHADFSLQSEKWGFTTSITYSDFSDLKMGSHGNESYVRPEYVDIINGNDVVTKNSDENIQKYSAYDQINVMQKIRFKPDNNLDINYGFHYSELSDVPRYDRLIEYSKDKLKYAEWYYGPQKWVMNSLAFRYSKSSLLYDDVKLILAYQDYEESRCDRKFGKSDLRDRTETVQAYSVNLDAVKEVDETGTLFYGLEGVFNKVGSDGVERNIFTGETKPCASRYPDNADYYSIAGYINYKNRMNEKMTFIAGLRYSQVVLNADFDKTFYNFPFENIKINTGTFNYSIGFAYNVYDDFQINVSAATGFRAPNIDDVGKVFDSEPGSVVVPNPDLSSEYAHNLDVTIIKSFNDKLKFELTGFYTLLKDAMVRRDFTFNGQDSILYDGTMSKVQALVNADKANVYGFHLSIDAELYKYLSFRSNLNYTYGEDQDGIPLRHNGPLFGSTHVVFNYDRVRADFYANYNGEVSYSNLAPSEREKPHLYAIDDKGRPYSPAWITLNLKTQYFINEHLRVTAGLENFLDERYRPYSSGIAAPGRNFIFSVNYKIN